MFFQLKIEIEFIIPSLTLTMAKARSASLWKFCSTKISPGGQSACSHPLRWRRRQSTWDGNTGDNELIVTLKLRCTVIVSAICQKYSFCRAIKISHVFPHFRQFLANWCSVPMLFHSLVTGSFHRSVRVHPRRADVRRPRRLFVHTLVHVRQLFFLQYFHA